MDKEIELIRDLSVMLEVQEKAVNIRLKQAKEDGLDKTAIDRALEFCAKRHLTKSLNAVASA